MDTDRQSSVLQSVRRQWQPVINIVVAACRGDAAAAEQLRPFLDHLAVQDDWRDLTKVLRRILAGERDAPALLASLDATDSLIAGHVLDLLGASLDGVPESLVQAIHAAETAAEDAELSLVDFIFLVVGALRAGTSEGKREQLRTMTQALAHASDSPESLRSLGGLLHGMLHGQPLDLSLVPPEFSGFLQGALASLLASERPPAEA